MLNFCIKALHSCCHLRETKLSDVQYLVTWLLWRQPELHHKTANHNCPTYSQSQCIRPFKRTANDIVWRNQQTTDPEPIWKPSRYGTYTGTTGLHSIQLFSWINPNPSALASADLFCYLCCQGCFCWLRRLLSKVYNQLQAYLMCFF